MRMRSLMLAKVMMAAAMTAAGMMALPQREVAAQYSPGGQAPYVDVTSPYGNGQGPYAPPQFSPASYAGMGGPSPMGPAPMGAPMGPMPGGPIGMGGGMPPAGMMAMGGGPPMNSMGPTGGEYMLDPSAGGAPYQGGYDGGYDGTMGGQGGYCDAWGYRINVFGDFLYLRPRNVEMAYAQVGTPGGFVPTAPLRLVDPDFSPGFRTGFGTTIGDSSAIVVTYAQLAAGTSDAVTNANIASLVSPFGVPGIGFASAAANSQIQFKLLDVDYKGLIANNAAYRAAWVVGGRYAKLDEVFNATFGGLATQQVASRIHFDGGGLKLGLDGERYSQATNFFGYGRASASFVGGQFRSTYQASTVPAVDTTWKAGRMVSIYDLEVGMGWRNFTNNLRFSMGYMYNAWFNVVKTDDWVNAVATTGTFNGLPANSNNFISFDGLVGRVEYLW